jgi:predicted CoA-binding protein
VTTPNPDDAAIREALSRARTIAVVGISDRPDRPSHEVASYLKAAGYRIIPVNPVLAGKEILGERCVASLAEIGHGVDIVDVFRRAEAVPDVVDDALRVDAPLLWLQLGIVNEDAAARARAAGRAVVQDRCIQIEHVRLLR